MEQNQEQQEIDIDGPLRFGESVRRAWLSSKEGGSHKCQNTPYPAFLHELLGVGMLSLKFEVNWEVWGTEEEGDHHVRFGLCLQVLGIH